MLLNERELGVHLRAVRKQGGHGLAVMERLSSVAMSTISQIERGREGRRLPPSAVRYARALGFELVVHVSYEVRPLLYGVPRRRSGKRRVS